MDIGLTYIRKNHPGLYNRIRIGITEEAWEDLFESVGINGINVLYTRTEDKIEKFKKIALKYSTPTKWLDNDNKTFATARRLKILDVVCCHMDNYVNIRDRLGKHNWSLHRLYEIGVLEYDTVPCITWDLQKFFACAGKYKFVEEWKEKEYNAYIAVIYAIKHNKYDVSDKKWFVSLIEHMIDSAETQNYFITIEGRNRNTK